MTDLDRADSTIEPVGEPPDIALFHSNILKQYKKASLTSLVARILDVEVLDNDILVGGISGSEVRRLRVVVRVPMKKSKLVSSFVIKINTKEGFSREIDIYNSVPPQIKKYFVNIDKEKDFALSDNDIYHAMIMKDLGKSQTLYQLLNSNRSYTSKITHITEVINTLKEIYSKAPKIENQVDALNYLYLGKISKTLIKKKDSDAFSPMIKNAKAVLSEIRDNCRCIEPPQLTLVHGDLHTRNIMLGQEITLIDIDNLDYNGDYIYDLGEIKADLSYISCPPIIKGIKNSSKSKSKIWRDCAKRVGALAEELAKLSGDSGWKSRYNLAQARFLFTCFLYSDDQKKSARYLEVGVKKLKSCKELMPKN